MEDIFIELAKESKRRIPKEFQKCHENCRSNSWNKKVILKFPKIMIGEGIPEKKSEGFSE